MSNYPDGVSDNDIDRVMAGSDDSEALDNLRAALVFMKNAIAMLEKAERDTNTEKCGSAISDSINWVEGYAIPYCEVAISELED